MVINCKWFIILLFPCLLHTLFSFNDIWSLLSIDFLEIKTMIPIWISSSSESCLISKIQLDNNLDIVFRLGVDFVLPMSQEKQEEQEEEEEEPPTKMYQKGVY